MYPLVDHAMIVAYGPRRAGKSYLFQTLLSHKPYMDQFDYISILSPSFEFNDDYYIPALVDDDRVHFLPQVDEDLINKIFESQAKCMRTVTDMRRSKVDQGDHNYTCPKHLMILDDIIDSGVVRFGNVVDKIAERGRHVNLACLITSQRISAISPSIRINSDYMLLFEPNAVAEFEKFLLQFVSRNLWKEMRNLSRDVYALEHNFILVDNVEHHARMKYGDAHAFMENRMEPLIIQGNLQQLKTGNAGIP